MIIAGVKDSPVRKIPLDEKFRIIPGALENLIKKDLEAGLKPWLIIGSAGTTDVGAIDPLEEMAAISQKYGAWFHVDAAYGAFFMLVESLKSNFKGIEQCDSVVMDPHKGLFLPYGSGVVIVKEGDLLKKAFSYSANYMQDAVSEDHVSPADISPELTKHFRGLRLWLPLQLHGVEPFKAALEEKYLLAQYLYQRLKEIPGIEIITEPELSVVAYRYVPEKGDANEFNQALINEIHKDGTIFISSTTIDGKFILRAAILVFRTHKQTVDLYLDILKEKIKVVEASFQA